jgi:hypothetical protein
MDFYGITVLNDTKLLPKSQLHAGELYRSEVAPLAAEVAFVSGVPSGDVMALQILATAIRERRPVICESCNASIYEDGHADHCELAARVREVRDVATGLVGQWEARRQAKRAALKRYREQVESAANKGFVVS